MTIRWFGVHDYLLHLFPLLYFLLVVNSNASCSIHLDFALSVWWYLSDWKTASTEFYQLILFKLAFAQQLSQFGSSSHLHSILDQLLVNNQLLSMLCPNCFATYSENFGRFHQADFRPLFFDFAWFHHNWTAIYYAFSHHYLYSSDTSFYLDRCNNQIARFFVYYHRTYQALCWWIPWDFSPQDASAPCVSMIRIDQAYSFSV